MPRVVETIDGTEYVFETIKIGVARRLQAAKLEASDFNVAFIAASLRAGGNAEATPEYVDDLPFYGGYFDKLLAGAFEANGLKLAREKKPAGEAEPAALEIAARPAAEESTSGTSTEASSDGTDTASQQPTS